MDTVIEIKAAEGGDDAKALVKNHVTMYNKFCNRRGL